MKMNAPSVGDTRDIKKFAFMPITCKIQGEDRMEKRWLCFVKIHQTWSYGWLNNWFIDENI